MSWKKELLIRVVDLEMVSLKYEEEIYELKKRVETLEKNVVKKTTRKTVKK